jgi:hypothetical protein
MALRNQNSTSGLAGNCNSTMTEGEGNLSQQDQRFHFEGNFLLKGIFCKMKEI